MVHEGLARVSPQPGNFAPHLISRYLEVYMRNPADVLERAEMHEEKGNYVEAERLYRKALNLKAVECDQASKKDKDSFELAPYLYNLGMSQYANDHLDDALLSFSRLLNIMSAKQEEIIEDMREIRNVMVEIKREAEEVEALIVSA